jgi:FKBP-type peptidyl-prolyl cis-trans isomerase (trigger factor)
MKQESLDLCQQTVGIPLDFNYIQVRPTFATLSIVVPKTYVSACFNQATFDQKKTLSAVGFNRGEVPIEYIEQNFMSGLTDHIQEFLFKYFVTPYLYKELYIRKILVTGYPRLKDIRFDQQRNASFDFELSTFEPISLQEWRYFPFKAPKRKKYKDIDRQVDSFVRDERELQKNFEHEDIIHVNDWVHFSVMPLDLTGKAIFEHEPLSLWLKMGDEDADEVIREAFVNRKKDEHFITNNRGLQDFFSTTLETNYSFAIHIKDILHNNYFCFELFKKHFKLKTNKDMLQKLIEVFSYRNDMSQRRTMTEEALALLLQKHKFDIPTHLIIRQKEVLLEHISLNPDYQVYRAQKDFNQRVDQLAEKQIKEMLILDQMAYSENIFAYDHDIKSYLNLIKRPRAKEFIYFDTPITRIDGKEAPVCAEELRHICMREKAINHIIHHLTHA